MSTEDSQATQAQGAAEPTAQETTETAELEDRWRRTAAELENVRKRCTRQVAEERWAERARVAAAWLPVVDNLERALEHAPPDGDPVLEGVRAVREQAVEVLAQLGFPRHAEIAVPFDPFVHEAVGVVAADDLSPGSVAKVLRPGYGEGEHLLRPAAVVVAGEPG